MGKTIDNMPDYRARMAGKPTLDEAIRGPSCSSPSAGSELPGYPRAETIMCPQCDHVQAAQVHFEDWMPFPAYVHDCEACGYTIMESEWERVPNVGGEN